MTAQSTATQTETFHCNGCNRRIPAPYEDKGPIPHGWERPVCTMCTNYWWYLEGPDDEDSEDHPGVFLTYDDEQDPDDD